MTTDVPDGTFESAAGPAIAFRRVAATGKALRAGVVWLGGFNSTMDGAKATSLDAWARARGRACLRFDSSGHGLSGGDIRDGTISRWLAEAKQAFDELTAGPQVLVGSSMGGWIAMLLARAHVAQVGADGSRIAGLVLIAPAADMTERLIWADASPETRRAIEEDGVWLRPSAYGDGPYPITRALIEDGRKHLILGERIAAHCPVRVLHGLDDPDVPWQHSLAVVDCLEGEDVTVTFVKGGDHRLSTDRDIARLGAVLDEVAVAKERPST
jgi:alpha-beta hydrolase superfamily lysophospholipase